MTFSVPVRKRLRPPSPPPTSLSTPIPTMQETMHLLPMTPPDPEESPILQPEASPPSIVTAVHVISTERDALAHLERIYLTDQLARENLELAVAQIKRTVSAGGKLVISGVGKSGKIGEKIVATMNSMGIQSTFLHPTEAMHGDLGIVKSNDTMLLISFSGKTPEMLLLLSHLPSAVSILAITSHTEPSLCPLLACSNSTNTILLPAPIHEHEEVSFGLSVPTTSTTVALALGDALALATARKLHTLPGRGPAEVFKGFHPGGAIGAASLSSIATPPLSASTPTSSSSSVLSMSIHRLQDQGSRPSPQFRPPQQRLISDLATPISIIPIANSDASQPKALLRVLDILRAAVRCPAAKSWVLLSPNQIIPPRQICALSEERDVYIPLSDLPNARKVAVDRKDWLCVPMSSTVEDVYRLIAAPLPELDGASNTSSNMGDRSEDVGQLDSGRSSKAKNAGRVIAIVDEAGGHVISVLEGDDVWDKD